MTNSVDGGAAFPSPGVVLRDRHGDMSQQGAYEGMTLRDYFAAAHMQGRASIMGFVDMDLDAEQAYKQADAMLKARMK